MDGFICEIEGSSGRSPSAILSEYFERPVHLAVKGNKPRPCDATDLYPSLKATAWYQDLYPLLVLSEESIDVLHKEIRSRVGTQGIEDQWSTQEFQIERLVLRIYSHCVSDGTFCSPVNNTADSFLFIDSGPILFCGVPVPLQKIILQKSALV